MEDAWFVAGFTYNGTDVYLGFGEKVYQGMLDPTTNRRRWNAEHSILLLGIFEKWEESVS
jgi:hypothetical protein